MKWKKYSICVNREYEETVTNILIADGIESFEISDNDVYADAFTGEFYAELQPDADTVSDKDEAIISFYGEIGGKDNIDVDKLNRQLVDALSLNEDTKLVSFQTVDDADWKDNWKEYFHAFTIEDILITPTWEADSKEVQAMPHQQTVLIDPGMSFGTGGHESTRLVIERLKKLVHGGERVLDLGCGSGILSVIAGKLGAASISGADIDPDCIISTADNLKQNGVSCGDGKFLIGDITTDETLIDDLGRESFDIVCANILADILTVMMPKMPILMRRGGCLITSGIIDFKEDEVKNAVEAVGLSVTDVSHRGEWVSITAMKI